MRVVGYGKWPHEVAAIIQVDQPAWLVRACGQRLRGALSALADKWVEPEQALLCGGRASSTPANESISVSYQGWDQSKTVLAGQTVCAELGAAGDRGAHHRCPSAQVC